MLHQRENNDISENHLKDNGEKLSRHCVEVLRLLYLGKKLTARELETVYNMDGRRLRDIYANRKDCKRDWRKDENGKNIGMEYWLEIPKPPTKSSVQDWWHKYQSGEFDSKQYIQSSLNL